MHLSSDLIAAWDTPHFNDAFKHEIEQLAAASLPLQQGLARTSYLSDEPFRVVVLASAAQGTLLLVRTGIFYSGIIAGCSCADDPTPVEAHAEYCELLFTIDRTSGATTVALSD